MAGNAGLLKHASNVPQSALFLDTLFERAGFPNGSFRALLIGGAEVGGVIADPRVKAVTLTGSEPAGRSVAAIAGDHVKKAVLELGGSDPFIVLPSADVSRRGGDRRACADQQQRPVLHRGQALHRAHRGL